MHLYAKMFTKFSIHFYQEIMASMFAQAPLTTQIDVVGGVKRLALSKFFYMGDNKMRFALCFFPGTKYSYLGSFSLNSLQCI